MKKITVLLTVYALFSGSVVYGSGCETGYACTLKNLKEENSITQTDKKQESDSEKEKQQKERQKKENGNFYNKYSSPEYTEMFMKYDF